MVHWPSLSSMKARPGRSSLSRCALPVYGLPSRGRRSGYLWQRIYIDISPFQRSSLTNRATQIIPRFGGGSSQEEKRSVNDHPGLTALVSVWDPWPSPRSLRGLGRCPSSSRLAMMKFNPVSPSPGPPAAVATAVRRGEGDRARRDRTGSAWVP